MGDRQRPRELLLFSGVAVAHLASAVGLLLYVFGAGMARFDDGAAAAPAEHVAQWMLMVLGVPLLTLLDLVPGSWFPRLWGYVPFLANAAVWGLAAVAIRRRRSHR